VTLRPLVLSVGLTAGAHRLDRETVDAATDANDSYCAFCGVRSGRWRGFVAAQRGDQDRVAVCPLCLLPQHLERPSIDEEAALVWLPEMSQAALNVTMREIYIKLRALGEDLFDAGRLRLDTAERRKLYHTRAALRARAAAAANRLGTSKPSDLAGALYRLSPGAYANRAKLLGGVHLLPLGRLYDRGRDVYPEIVDAWREIAAPPVSAPSGYPAPRSGA
jgi:hypothetical protein